MEPTTSAQGDSSHSNSNDSINVSFPLSITPPNNAMIDDDLSGIEPLPSDSETIAESIHTDLSENDRSLDELIVHNLSIEFETVDNPDQVSIQNQTEIIVNDNEGTVQNLSSYVVKLQRQSSFENDSLTTSRDHLQESNSIHKDEYGKSKSLDIKALGSAIRQNLTKLQTLSEPINYHSDENHTDEVKEQNVPQLKEIVPPFSSNAISNSGAFNKVPDQVPKTFKNSTSNSDKMNEIDFPEICDIDDVNDNYIFNNDGDKIDRDSLEIDLKRVEDVQNDLFSMQESLDEEIIVENLSIKEIDSLDSPTSKTFSRYPKQSRSENKENIANRENIGEKTAENTDTGRSYGSKNSKDTTHDVESIKDTSSPPNTYSSTQYKDLPPLKMSPSHSRCLNQNVESIKNYLCHHILQTYITAKGQRTNSRKVEDDIDELLQTLVLQMETEHKRDLAARLEKQKQYYEEIVKKCYSDDLSSSLTPKNSPRVNDLSGPPALPHIPVGEFDGDGQLDLNSHIEWRSHKHRTRKILAENIELKNKIQNLEKSLSELTHEKSRTVECTQHCYEKAKQDVVSTLENSYQDICKNGKICDDGLPVEVVRVNKIFATKIAEEQIAELMSNHRQEMAEMHRRMNEIREKYEQRMRALTDDDNKNLSLATSFENRNDEEKILIENNNLRNITAFQKEVIRNLIQHFTDVEAEVNEKLISKITSNSVAQRLPLAPDLDQILSLVTRNNESKLNNYSLNVSHLTANESTFSIEYPDEYLAEEVKKNLKTALKMVRDGAKEVYLASKMRRSSVNDVVNSPTSSEHSCHCINVKQLETAHKKIAELKNDLYTLSMENKELKKLGSGHECTSEGFGENHAAKFSLASPRDTLSQLLEKTRKLVNDSSSKLTNEKYLEIFDDFDRIGTNEINNWNEERQQLLLQLSSANKKYVETKKFLDEQSTDHDSERNDLLKQKNELEMQLKKYQTENENLKSEIQNMELTITNLEPVMDKYHTLSQELASERKENKYLNECLRERDDEIDKKEHEIKFLQDSYDSMIRNIDEQTHKNCQRDQNQSPHPFELAMVHEMQEKLKVYENMELNAENAKKELLSVEKNLSELLLVLNDWYPICCIVEDETPSVPTCASPTEEISVAEKRRLLWCENAGNYHSENSWDVVNRLDSIVKKISTLQLVIIKKINENNQRLGNMKTKYEILLDENRKNLTVISQLQIDLHNEHDTVQSQILEAKKPLLTDLRQLKRDVSDRDDKICKLEKEVKILSAELSQLQQRLEREYNNRIAKESTELYDLGPGIVGDASKIDNGSVKTSARTLSGVTSLSQDDQTLEPMRNALTSHNNVTDLFRSTPINSERVVHFNEDMIEISNLKIELKAKTAIVNDLETKLENSKIEMERAQSEIAELKKDLNARCEEIDGSQKEVLEMMQKLEEIRETSSEKDSELSKIKRECAHYETRYLDMYNKYEQMNELQKCVDKLEKNLQTETELRKNIEKELAKKSAEHDELIEEEIATKNNLKKIIDDKLTALEELQKKVIEKEQLIEARDETIKELNSKNAKDMETIAKLSNEIEDMQRQMEFKESIINQMTSDAAKLEHDLSLLRNQIHENGNVLDLTKKNDALVKENKELTSNLIKLRQESPDTDLVSIELACQAHDARFWQEQYNLLEIQHDALTRDFRRVTDKKENLKREYSTLVNELEELKNKAPKIAEILQDYRELKDAADNAAINAQSLHSQLDDEHIKQMVTNNTFKKMNDEKLQLEVAFVQMQNKMTKKQKSIEARDQTIKTLKSEIINKIEIIAKLNEEVDHMRQQIMLNDGVMRETAAEYSRLKQHYNLLDEQTRNLVPETNVRYDFKKVTDQQLLAMYLNEHSRKKSLVFQKSYLLSVIYHAENTVPKQTPRRRLTRAPMTPPNDHSRDVRNQEGIFAMTTPPSGHSRDLRNQQVMGSATGTTPPCRDVMASPRSAPRSREAVGSSSLLKSPELARRINRAIMKSPQSSKSK